MTARIPGPTGPRLTGRARGPASRRRLLGAAVLLLPVLELAVLIAVGTWLGFWPTLALLLAGAAAGVLVLRHVGTTAIRRLRAGVSGGAPAAAGVPRPAADPALAVVAGVLLIVPGFLSDVAGIALLVPPVRSLLVRRAGEAVLRRLQVHQVRIVQGEVFTEPGHPVDVRITQVPRSGRPAAPTRPPELTVRPPPRRPPSPGTGNSE